MPTNDELLAALAGRAAGAVGGGGAPGGGTPIDPNFSYAPQAAMAANPYPASAPTPEQLMMMAPPGSAAHDAQAGTGGLTRSQIDQLQHFMQQMGLAPPVYSRGFAGPGAP
jgi:hypothetical protein